MTVVGEIEWETQKRLIKVFVAVLGYNSLGNLKDQSNSNICEGDLETNLFKRGVEQDLIGKAVYQIKKEAGDTSKSLYDRNREVYSLLRYGVKVKPGVSENTVTVWPIDWKNPRANDFAIAWEVTVSDPEGKRAQHGRRSTTSPGRPASPNPWYHWC